MVWGFAMVKRAFSADEKCCTMTLQLKRQQKAAWAAKLGGTCFMGRGPVSGTCRIVALHRSPSSC